MLGKKLIGLFLICIPSISIAFFCPTNFNQINEGDSTDQVKKQCGKPNSEETNDKKIEGPQEWNYYIPQTVGVNSFDQAQGTLKTQVAFDKDGKAVNISVNGIGVGATTICGSTVQLGDDRDKFKASCGDPSFINRQNPADAASAPPPIKVTTFTYNTNPVTHLIFEDGKLIRKE